MGIAAESYALRVKLYNGNEQITARIIIDSGSKKSYITKEAASCVGYTPIAEQLMTHSLFGEKKTGKTRHKKYLVYLSSLNDNYSCNFLLSIKK